MKSELSPRIIEYMEFVQSCLRSIEPTDFLASQALTCKIELTLRDLLYFHAFKSKEFYFMKEVAQTYKRSSCDLVLYSRKNNEPVLNVELKQYYSDDLAYNDEVRIQILDVLKRDFLKYDPITSTPLLNVLFIVHFNCDFDSYKKHGEHFKYFHTFHNFRKKNSIGAKLGEECITFMKLLGNEFQLTDPTDQPLGTFNDIECRLFTSYYSFGENKFKS